MKYLILIFLFILISVIGGVSAGSLPPIDNAMKTCYFNSNNSAFGESYGNWSNNMTYDYSNNHLNGTIIGGMIWNATDGRLGNGSFTFDGVNDYISNPYIQVNYSNNWTINLWLKRHGNETLKGFFQRDFGVLTYFAKNGKIIIEYTNVSNGYKGTSGNLFYVPFDEWHMLTYDIYNNGTATFMKLYYDGKQNFTQTITSEGLYDANIALRIGYMFSGTNLYWNGSIDDFIIYNRSLSGWEISHIYMDYVGCVIPYVGMTTSYYTKFCNGTYNLNVSSNSVAITIGESNSEIDMNGARIKGNFTAGGSQTFRPRMMQGNSKNNVTIHNGIIDDYWIGISLVTGNGEDIHNITGYNTASVIDFDRINESVVHDITTLNASAFGTELTYSQNLTFYNINCSNNDIPNVPLVSNSKACLYTAIGNNMWVTNSTFYNHGGLSTKFNNSNIENVRFLNSLDRYGRHIDAGHVSDPTTYGLTIKDNYFENHDGAIYLENITNILIQNNTFYNSTKNTDTYDMAIHCQYDCNNITVINNNFTNFNIAILLRQTNVTTITGNSFNNNLVDMMYMNFDCVSNLSEYVLGCNTDPITGVFYEEWYKGFIPIGWAGGANYTGAHVYESHNMNFYNNTFTNVPVAIRSQSNEKVTTDFVGWFRSFRIVSQADRDDFYLSNQYDCAFKIQNHTIAYDLQYGIASDHKYSHNYSLCKTYTYFTAWDQTILNPYGSNNSAIYLFKYSDSISSLTIFGNGTGLITNNSINISLNSSQRFYSFSNYILSEPRILSTGYYEGEPFNLTGDNRTKFVRSSLTNSINIPINFTVDNCSVTSIDYTSYGSVSHTYLNNTDFNCTDNSGIYTVYFNALDIQGTYLSSSSSSPSGDSFNLIFVLNNTNRSVYYLEFATNRTSVSPKSYPSVGEIDTFPEVTLLEYAIDPIDRSVNGHMSQSVKSIFGLNELPVHSNNSFFYSFFRIEQTQTNGQDGGIVGVYLNMSRILLNSGNRDGFNNQSLRLFQTDIFGYTIPFNSSQNDIPFNVA